MINQKQGFRLSPQQKRLWWGMQKEQVQRACCLIRIDGPLNIQRLQAAVHTIVQHHQVLRTAYQHIPGMKTPLQYISDTSTYVWQCIDMHDCDLREQERGVEQFFQQEMSFVSAQEREVPLRLMLVVLSASEHLLLVSLPALSADSDTFKNLVQKIGYAYGNPDHIEERELDDIIQYIQFSEWQHELLKDEEETERGKEYWYKQGRSSISTLILPGEKRSATAEVSIMQAFTCELPADVAGKIEHVLLQHDISASLFFLACWQTLLWRLTRERDITINTVLNGREHEEFSGALGLYAQSLPIHCHFTVNASFRDILEQLYQAVSSAETWQEYFVEEHDQSDLPISFELEERPEPYHVSGVTFSVQKQHTCSKPFKLKLSCIRQEHTQLQLFYDATRFASETIERLAGQLLSLIHSVAVDPERSINEVDILSARERQQLQIHLNQTRVAYPSHQCFHQLFEEQVVRTPDNVAVVYADQYLTYTELNARANQLAHHLRSLGVGPDVLVAICLERSLEMIVGLLGILKAGGAYVPLDPAYPQARLLSILEDIHAPVLITNTRLSAPFSAHTIRQVCLDVAWEDISRESTANPSHDVLPEHLAYVIYTSGSTGQPKGVGVCHAQVTRLFAATQPYYHFTEQDCWTHFHSVAFDFSVWEIWGALLYGGRLLVVPYWVSRSPMEFAELLQKERVTILNQTPSAFYTLQQTILARKETDLALRLIIFGGEALDPARLRPWVETYGDIHPALVNMYGITETTVHVTYAPMHKALIVDSSASLIGQPLADLQMYLLDASMQPVPPGVYGEIYVGGAGLARGYIEHPELTATRFLPHPFSTSPGARLYRTGDVACYLPNGNIEYVGRLDKQVKLRGYRIELGEIETTLMRHPGVCEAVVLVQEDVPGDKQLVVYVVLCKGQQLSIEEFHQYLATSLPSYMLPSRYVFLEALPLTPAGKVDSHALSSLASSQQNNTETFVAPRTILEKHLASMWQEMLHMERVSVNDSFFDLGGDSIKAAIFINRLQELLGVILYVVILFDAPTVAGLADYLTLHHLDMVERVFGAGAHLHAETLPHTARPIDVARLEHIRSLIPPLLPLSRERKWPTKNPPAVFVLSPPRSGSTLLRVMLAGHPRLFAPPELELLSFNLLRERREAFTGRNSFWLEGTVRTLMEINGWDAETAKAFMTECEQQDLTTQEFYALMQQQLNGRILVDKTPAYALDMTILQRAEEDFEQAHYIHLIRHPYGMIHSFEEAALDKIFFRYPHAFETRELAELVWLMSHQNIKEFLHRIPAHRQIQVRFEELVQRPAQVMEDLAAFLQVEFHADMVQPYIGPRMTDGIYAPSKMLGDIKFHQHKTIDAAVAHRWQETYRQDFLGEITWQMAETVGYSREMSRQGPRQGNTASSLGSVLAPIVRLSREGQHEFPLSFAQQRLWFLDQLQPGSTAYLVPRAHYLHGPLQPKYLERSLEELIHRHETLRTTFVASRGQPMQVIHPAGRHSLPLVNLCGLGQEQRKHEAQKLARQEAERPCDLAQGPLIRTSLLQLDHEEYVLLLTLHHIIIDGWSEQVLTRELVTLYRAFVAGQPSPLAPLPIQYADYAFWQRQWLQGEVLEAQLDYWTRRLGGSPPIELPIDYPRPSAASSRGAAHRFTLAEELLQALGVLCRQEGMTLFMVLLAAFQVLFYRSTGQTDIVIGTDSANRNRAEIEGMVGFFVNLLALRTNMSGKPTFRAVLKQVREIVLGAYTHQETPFELLVEKLAPDHYLDRTPLVQVLFVLQNISMEIEEQANAEQKGKRKSIDQSSFHFVADEKTTVKFDLALFMREHEGKLFGTLNYRQDLFKASTIATMVAQFESLLQALVKQPDLCIDLLEIASDTAESTHQEQQNLRQELLVRDGEWFDILEGF